MDSNINNISVLSQIRHNISLESDRRKIEHLASKRNELQNALKIIHEDENSKNVQSNGEQHIHSDLEKNGSSDGYYFMSSWNNASTTTHDITSTNFAQKNNTQSPSSTSLFFMDKEDTKSIIEMKLKQVEKELIEVCSEVQRSMDMKK